MEPADVHSVIQEEVSKVLIGNEETVEHITISLLTKGHVLLEGVPGVAKTTIAMLLARAIGLDYNRIQMTPDILPADITGTHVYRETTGTFEVRFGPVFANVVLADEINRAPPKTQSALLEAMQEGTVTIEGETHSLPDPFVVIATQNPIEMEGTFELPQAQRDRFQFKPSVDVPERTDELELMDRFDENPDLDPSVVSQVVSVEDLTTAREAVSDVYIDDKVKKYILRIVTTTRESPELDFGASPRSTLTFIRASKARAAVRDREYVIPDDVKALARPILAHRLVQSSEAELSDVTTREIIDEVLSQLSPPGAPESEDGGGTGAATD